MAENIITSIFLEMSYYDNKENLSYYWFYQILKQHWYLQFFLYLIPLCSMTLIMILRIFVLKLLMLLMVD